MLILKSPPRINTFNLCLPSAPARRLSWKDHWDASGDWQLWASPHAWGLGQSAGKGMYLVFTQSILEYHVIPLLHSCVGLLQITVYIRWRRQWPCCKLTRWRPMQRSSRSPPRSLPPPLAAMQLNHYLPIYTKLSRSRGWIYVWILFTMSWGVELRLY